MRFFALLRTKKPKKNIMGKMTRKSLRPKFMQLIPLDAACIAASLIKVLATLEVLGRSFQKEKILKSDSFGRGDKMKKIYFVIDLLERKSSVIRFFEFEYV